MTASTRKLTHEDLLTWVRLRGTHEARVSCRPEDVGTMWVTRGGGRDKVDLSIVPRAGGRRKHSTIFERHLDPDVVCRLEIKDTNGRYVQAATIIRRLLDPEVKSEADVEAWFRELKSAGISFHPDDTFEDYEDRTTGESIFTARQAGHLNEAMNKAHEVCNTLDVYEVALAVTEGSVV